MKKLLLFLAAAVYLFIGCQDNNLLETADTPTELTTAEPNWVELPEPVEETLSKLFSNGAWIDVDKGGTIKTTASYWTFSWWNRWNIKRKVTAAATLDFPRNVWDKNQYGQYKYIILSIDDRTASSRFNPHIEFDNPVIYNAKFTGLNLSEVDAQTINFVYQSPNGSVEEVEYEALNIDVEEGILEIVNAKIPHFSRYGFTW